MIDAEYFENVERELRIEFETRQANLVEEANNLVDWYQAIKHNASEEEHYRFQERLRDIQHRLLSLYAEFNIEIKQ